MPHVDLLELPYFEGISIDDLVSLVDLMEPYTYRPGDVIIEEGNDTPPPLYIATTGKVVITKHAANRERALAELDSPTLFGEVELFCQIGPVATARALTMVETYCLTRPNYERLFNAQHPAVVRFTFNVARVACHRLAVADEIMAQRVNGEDLVKIRRAVFARMRSEHSWDSVTGMFRRADLEQKK